MQIKDYIDSNKDRFLDELYDLLRIESVSADPKFKDSVDRAADYLVDQFKKLNLDAVEKIKTCLLYTSPSPRDATLSRMPSSA